MISEGILMHKCRVLTSVGQFCPPSQFPLWSVYHNLRIGCKSLLRLITLPFRLRAGASAKSLITVLDLAPSHRREWLEYVERRNDIFVIPFGSCDAVNFTS